MLSYLSPGGQKTHLIDELTRGKDLGPGKTLCGREVQDGTIQESDRVPGCIPCATQLRRLQRQAKPERAPLKAVPMPLVDARDFLCPLCQKPMGLGTKRIRLPSQSIDAVRVTVVLICNNAEGHKEKQ